MQLRKSLKKISIFITSLITTHVFSGPNTSYLHPQNNWLSVISICSAPKFYEKKDYDGYMKIIDNYKNKDKNLTLCKKTKDKTWQKIQIKRRGNSSDNFAKKQYRIKLFDENNEKIKKSLGGMAKSSKWVLNAPYVDRSHIRNIFTFSLGRIMGENRGDVYFAPQTKSYELFLNGEYQGLYVLIEKIEQGKDKVDIEKIKNQKPHDVSFISEISSNDGDFKSEEGTYLNYRYPSAKKLREIGENDPQREITIKKSIQTSIKTLEEIFSNKNKLNKIINDPKQKIFAIDSFVDFILVQEITKNVDGFRRSAFFYRKADGVIHMGPLWDFNLALGNLSFYCMSKTEGWLHEHKYGVLKNAFWFKALLKNKSFHKRLAERYHSLRQDRGVLSDHFLFNLINKKSYSMRTASLRDFHAWQGTFSFAERNFMTTYEKGTIPNDHVKILKNWLSKRLQWIDENINNI